MSSWSLDTVPRRIWAISHELPDSGETAVFDEGRSELVLLNATAARAWALIDGRRSVRQIAASLIEMAEGPPEADVVEEQLTRFFEDMRGRGALGESDGRS